MTFIAQPYEQFVDDLLTALTGGVVREEHQFIGIEVFYSLGYPGAIASSIKVFGQSNDAFAFFEINRDFSYDPEQELIKWNKKGNLPDDNSFFYVNYYLKEGRRRLSDRNPGSVTTTLAEAFAREFAVLHKQMEMIYKSAFVDLSTGYSLDHIASLLDITRKDAKFASGEVIFRSSSPAQGDITIPSGSLVSTDSGQNFETTEKRTLRKGQMSVACPIRAQAEGPTGLVKEKAIKYIHRPIYGIESVINEASTFFVTDKETDEELRSRIKGTLERAGKSTLEAIRYSLIEDLPEITENNIQIVEQAKTPGYVEVKFGLGAIPDAELADLVKRIEESIFYSRAAGVRVTHNLPTTAKPESVREAEEKSEETWKNIINEFKEKGKPDDTIDLAKGLPSQKSEEKAILPLRAKVLLKLSEQNSSIAQKEKIEDNIRSQVAKFINDIPMGMDLVYNKLLGTIVEPKEIADAALLIGMKSQKDFYHSNLSTGGRKSKIEISDIYVGLMEEDVFIDIKVKLKLSDVKPEAKKVDPESLRKVLDDYHSAVEAAINRILANASGKLSKGDIKLEVQKAIVPQLQLIEGDAIAMNANYEETGRILNNTDQVDLEENQVIKLRNLTLSVPGVLDV